MYGKYFKRLRNYKKLSLREAADGITSSPALSRWENEADDIRLQKFLALLHRVDVTPREFFAYTELQGNVENSYYETIHLLARQKNAHRLYQIYLRQISRFHQTHDPDRLGKAVAADNFCFQLTQKKHLSQADLAEFINLLQDSEYLDFKTLRFLENASYLLKTNLLLTFTRKIIQQLDHFEAVDYELYVDAWTSLTNILLSLIQQKKFSDANQIIEQLLLIDLSEQMAAFKIRLAFFKKLIAYRITNDDLEINDFLSRLNKIGLSSLSSELLAQWHNIY